jgi:hypothetical protein
MSMKNSSDTIGNQTRFLLACSTVPQSTAPLHAPEEIKSKFNYGNACRDLDQNF